MIHFIKHPGTHIPTRKERLQSRTQMEKMATFFKIYALMFVGLVLVAGAVGKFSGGDPTQDLHDTICRRTPNSVFCTNKELYIRLYDLTEKQGVPPALMFGIAFAESTLHTNYNQPICKSYNNPFGLKGRKFDDGSVQYYHTNRQKPDENGCWLYKFDSLEQAFDSMINTITLGYKTCNMRTLCIAYSYVGDPNVAEQSWIERVSIFYQS